MKLTKYYGSQDRVGYQWELDKPDYHGVTHFFIPRDAVEHIQRAEARRCARIVGKYLDGLIKVIDLKDAILSRYRKAKS